MNLQKIVITTSVKQWGNGLAIRLNKAVAKAAGVKKGSPVRIIVQASRIVIEPSSLKLTLEDRLTAFDPQRHGGERMAFHPIGAEVFK